MAINWWRMRWLVTRAVVCRLIGHDLDDLGDLLRRCERCGIFEVAS
jgi:hypothetical protein